MTIFESSQSAKHFGLQLELPVLQELGRVLVVVLWLYAILRFEDLAHRGRNVALALAEQQQAGIATLAAPPLPTRKKFSTPMPSKLC